MKHSTFLLLALAAGYLMWKKSQATAAAQAVSPAAATGALGAQALFNLIGAGFD